MRKKKIPTSPKRIRKATIREAERLRKKGESDAELFDRLLRNGIKVNKRGIYFAI